MLEEKDCISDKVKYFVSNNRFCEGKIVEILPHGSLVIKNKETYTNDKINKLNLILNLSLVERKLINNILPKLVDNNNKVLEIERNIIINKYNKYFYVLVGLTIPGVVYVFRQMII
jgi:hypothetical protein